MSEPIDLLISARWVIPVDAGNTVLPRHSVAVRDGRIVDIVPTDIARERFHAHTEKQLPDHALLPGLINLHTHAAMTLMRGIADDLPLMAWLQTAIWPTEAKHISSAFVRDGTLLAAAEMLRGGITTCNEMYFHPAAAAEAFDLMGMRSVIGITTIDFPTPYAASADEYLSKGLAARDAWRGHPLLRFTLAPHAPYTVSDTTFQRIVSLANELDLPIHIHIHETAQEIEDSLKQYGERPLERLARLGVVDSQLIGVHAVHLTPAEIQTLARHGAAIAHCPTSNMKLASGIAPVAAALNHGVTVGLGTDGAASNNRLDIFQEMRMAALLAKVSTLDAAAVPAATALRMATLDGARALGMENEIGSLESGKWADLCAVDLSPFETQPCFDPVSHLVYCAGREHVSDVWIAGQARVLGKQVLQKADSELLGLARVWQNKLGSRFD
ncbi:TRZ/ATZ family hydrolase [Denitromonas iodatirespirans]|uniref:5-methylthioadenosine/S-adenosylhomocysteine deaminase n=1 Tax=Denitromonas iodatirespirans TaxID=2795389 RepID=A0A944D8J2_DENI1|nr:TRZ/ATZ family hydrolase [Denitromonas iodatirespirans]MBT0961934.1 TRZ/ATZ family hydrolase [Denitromonas iodatirespirans]